MLEPGAVAVNQLGAGEATSDEAGEAMLVQAAQRDPAAFAPLYRRYVTPIYRYVYSRLGNAPDAEDLTSQVFLDALQGLPRYRHRGRFLAWLFTIARRRLADRYRHRPRAAADLPEDYPAGEPDPLAQAVQAGQLQQLRALLATCDEDDQELLRLRYAAGLSFAQIGDVVGRREGAVKMRLHRLLARLQSRWEGNDD